MKKIIHFIVLCGISFLSSSCLENITSSTTNSSTTDTTATNNNTACTQNYQTSDLRGCFSPDNASFLEYYGFDGVSTWKKDFWTPISGCSTTEGGNYLVDKCTVTVCDSSGCSDYQVQATSTGLLLDGEPYTENNGCS